jgi:hypothetical protein
VIIRSLAIDEYAYYTIANTALGAMSVVTDSGVTSGVFAEGGKVWQDRARLGAVLSAGLAIRKRLSGLAVLVAVPLLGLLLRRQGASWLPNFCSRLRAVLYTEPHTIVARAEPGQSPRSMPACHQSCRGM